MAINASDRKQQKTGKTPRSANLQIAAAPRNVIHISHVRCKSSGERDQMHAVNIGYCGTSKTSARLRTKELMRTGAHTFPIGDVVRCGREGDTRLRYTAVPSHEQTGRNLAAICKFADRADHGSPPLFWISEMNPYQASRKKPDTFEQHHII